jgi:YVTN family beta-propeller protein
VRSSFDRIYVANTGSNTLSVIDTQNNTKIGKDIPVGRGPWSVVLLYLSKLDSRLYVANSLDNTVSVINGTDNTKIGQMISL